MLKVQGHESLLRDVSTGAIVNSSASEYQNYMIQKSAREANQEQLASNTKDINIIKGQLTQIQSLLEQLIGKQ